MSLTVLAVITARGGSKGLPGKNVCPLRGRPLIAWTVDAARHSRLLTRTIVSTDDSEIARAARACGGEVPFLRPARLAEDATAHVPVLEHALEWARATGMEPDYLLVLQPTSPLRTAGDIDAAIEIAEARRPEAVVSVSPVHPHPWLAHRLAADGMLEPFMADREAAGRRRQDLPAAYALNGAIYLITPLALRTYGTFCPPAALGYVMPAERSIDIDDAHDLLVAEALLNARGERGDAGV